jgi:two-component system, cell cycle response regulator
MSRRVARWTSHALLILGALLLAVFTARAVAPGALPWVPSTPLYDVVDILGTLAIVVRAAAVREQRAAWILIAVGVCASTMGDVLSTIIYASSAEMPVPSWCDPLWLGFYPPVVVAAALLTRGRVHGLRSGMWLDGVAGALTVAAVMSAALVAPLVRQVAGEPLPTLLTNAAYPVGDLVVVAALVATTAVAGWHLDRRWLLLVAGTLAFVASDCAYLVGTAAGTYADGGLPDVGWLAAALIFGLAAWAPARPLADRHAAARGAVLAPVVFAAAALGVVLHQALTRPAAMTLVFAAAALAVVIGRLTAVHADHQRLLRESRLDAATDELTGLWNRRRLMADLEAAAADGTQRVLLMLDLDGFKSYNDTFGHPAGDRLLRLVGADLDGVVAPRGTAYRLGGDEFCALLDLAPGEAPTAAGAAVAAAIESRGDGFHVGASFGWAELPAEAPQPSDALRLADRRLYAAKDGGRTSAARQSADVLRAVLAERDPVLGAHVDGVAALAEAVGRRLGLSRSAVRLLRRAAELHDVGKVAIPDAILTKAGALDDAEWALMREHTAIGERILSAAPALSAVAGIVRSAHERIDGAGYPDRLAGDAIPLEARIVFVCDAFDAMTSSRPYDAARTPAAAIAELRRGAGTQFDARVVEAFAAELAEGSAALTRSAPSRSSAPAPAPSR